MEAPYQIIILLLSTFFGIQQPKIMAEKTIIEVNPTQKEVIITHENPFSIIRNNNDEETVKKEWNELLAIQKKQLKTLKNFSLKSFTLYKNKKEIQPKMVLSYSSNNDLSTIHINYNKKLKKFTFFIPSDIKNIKGKNGLYNENEFWHFPEDENFSLIYTSKELFTKEVLKFKKTIEKIVH